MGSAALLPNYTHVPIVDNNQTMHFTYCQIHFLRFSNVNTLFPLTGQNRWQLSAWAWCLFTYLKKSWRQKSRPSRAKHLSASAQRHSLHWTHLACQTRSNTFSRNRSRMGPSQPAHSSSMPPAGSEQPGYSLVTDVVSTPQDFIQ